MHQEIIKKELLEEIKSRAIQYGKFKLASGGESNYFLDMKKVTMDSIGCKLIGDLMAYQMLFNRATAIGGMETGAIPIASSTIRSIPSCIYGRFNSFFVRKQPKKTGTKVWIEGVIENDSRILLVEDVVTKGGSVLRAVSRIKEEYPNCKIVRIVSIVDRFEGGAENIEKAGYVYKSIFTIDDLGISHV